MTRASEILAVALLAALAAATPGCRHRDAGIVVATTSLGDITMDDVDDYVISLPPARRRDVGNALEDWERLVRDMVVEDELLKAARADGTAASKEVAESALEMERGALADLCFERSRPADLAPVDDAAVRAFYDEHRDQYRRPARRLVYGIFLRQADGVSREELRGRAAALRQRILAGERFEDVARTSSDSESRVQGGLIGWLEEATAPADLARVVFALSPGTPSDPVGTSDGYHIFLVEQVMEEKTFSLDEMTQTVRQHLLAQRKEEAIGRITGNAPLPDGSFVPTEEELRDIAAAGDPEAIALHVGDYALPLRRLLVLSTEAARRPGAAAGGWIPYQMVRALADRERLCLHCVEAKVATHAEAAERVAARRDDLAIDAERRKRLESFVDRHPERLQDFFERSKKRFMTPLRLHVVEISVPPGPDPVATMASLERACAAIDGGESVDDAASALGGRAEDLGFQTLADLRRRDPRAALAAAKLETGKVSAPWTRKGSLVAMRIVERKEPEERELAAVRDQAIASYLEAHQQDVYREVSDEILAGVSFALDRKKLEAAIPARPPAGAPAGELEDGG